MSKFNSNDPKVSLHNFMNTVQFFSMGIQNVSDIYTRALEKNQTCIPIEKLQFVKDIDESINKLQERYNELMFSLNNPILSKVKFNLLNSNLLINNLENSLKIYANSFGIKYSVDKDNVEDKIISIDNHFANDVLENLIKNAYEANATEINQSHKILWDKKSYVVTLSDDGDGMDEETLKKCIRKGYSTKNSDGLEIRGLGLFNAYQFAKVHNGELEIESKLGKGTKFKFYFPLSTFVVKDREF